MNQTSNHKELLKKVRRIEIKTRHAVNDVFAGRYHSTFKGRGMEFDEVREYVPGDDIRSIDWNVTARTGVPHIKKFVEEREMTVMLMVDISGSNDFGSTPQLKRDLAAEVAAMLAFSATRNNDRIGLILFSDQVEKYIPPRKGPRHVLRIIKEVLSHEPQSTGTDAAPALDYLNHTQSRKAVTFLISDFIFPINCERPLKITARRHDLIAVAIGDNRERALPAAGLVEWRDPETGGRVLVDTSSAAVRRELLLAQEERIENLHRTLRRAGIDIIELFAGQPYDKPFIKFFRTRSSRR
ncbi:DUF58 domain-containing protein [Tichowtungia aerotolerans]|uniref:DUF58 domain-containing protein n=1 Tax=Tichowtungia aerotolerans TaxID=2697043 RepID=A0A6P1MAI2_9BACT|nr:DUF58 domain-containing protein [Tichowtungia aerotolerans]QHI70103.1 DUF58 domain-containing protein [Tichowtungia aerotolerans]